MMKRAYSFSSSDDSMSDDDQDETLYKLKKEFLSVISTTMYTFGDSKVPSEESVELMYAILREQMDILLMEAERTAHLRRNSEISHEDILFLMRKNKEKLKHLLQYIQVLDIRPAFSMNIELAEDGLPLKMNRLGRCMRFLASIEDCGEFTCLLDDENFTLPEYARKRLERRMAVMELMKGNEYEEFSKALQVSFGEKRLKNFKRWLLQSHATNLHITQLALTMISFLARETIAVVVDKALLIKLKKLNGNQTWHYSSNPFDLSEANPPNVKDNVKNYSNDDAFESIKVRKESLTCSKFQEGVSSHAILDASADDDTLKCHNSEFNESIYCLPMEDVSAHASRAFSIGITDENPHNIEEGGNTTLIFERKISSKYYSKYFGLKASKKICKDFLCREAISTTDIKEALSQLGEPSPLVYFFNNYPVCIKKKICLLESFEDF